MNEEKIEQLEQEIMLIKERNARVAADKAWETSTFCICSICVITYIVAAAVMYFIGVEKVLVKCFNSNTWIFSFSAVSEIYKTVVVKERYTKNT